MLKGACLGTIRATRMAGAALAAIILAGCTTVPTRPSEILPLVEVQINNTPTHADDVAPIYFIAHVPGRMRITNPNSSIGGGIHADVPVTLANIGPCGGFCAHLQFSTTYNAMPYHSTLQLVLPRNGAWVQFWVRGDSQVGISQTVTDAVLEVREHRTGGNVLARQGLAVTYAMPAASQRPAAIIEILRTPLSLDDYLTWAPAPATVRLAAPSGLSSPLAVILRNAAPVTGQPAPGGLRFAPDSGNGPPAPAAMTSTLSLSLPQNGGAASFWVAGDFDHASVRDKDAIIEVFNPAEADPARAVIEHLGVMVRIRKNANGLTDNERSRFLSAVRTLNAETGEYANYVAINAQVGARANSFDAGPPAPAFFPWHRLYLLRFERALQGLDPSVALPYWRYDEAAPHVFSADFMGRTGDGPTVETTADNPLASWGIVRDSAFPPGASPTLTAPAQCNPVSDDNILNHIGNRFQNGAGGGFMWAERITNHPAVHAAAGACVGFQPGWLAQPATAARDPLFFLLYANSDRLWAKWQTKWGRFDPANPDSYGIAACGLPMGQCLRDRMWPWVDPAAPGGRFPVGVIGSYLQPPDQPTPADAIGLDRSVTWNTATGQWIRLQTGLGYGYDDVPPTP